jgi:hypothetical protein
MLCSTKLQIFRQIAPKSQQNQCNIAEQRLKMHSIGNNIVALSHCIFNISAQKRLTTFLQLQAEAAEHGAKSKEPLKIQASMI